MFSRKINDNIFYSKEEDPPHRHTSDRIAAIDALRGFDMFWIIGGNKVLAAFILLFLNPLPRWLSSQFEHARWNGFSAWDLIMPLFLFIVGVSLPFSFGRKKGARRQKMEDLCKGHPQNRRSLCTRYDRPRGICLTSTFPN